ncbi:MAG: amidohydrolase [Sphingomonadaceae bacterium]|nr:amidohydrolase [Sphingomonadaceae bacterium]
MATVTPLRKQSQTTRELLQDIKVIDVDTHVSEPHDLWTSRASNKFKDLLPRVVGEGKDRHWVIGEGEYLAGRNAVSAIRKDGVKSRGMEFVEWEIPDVMEACWETNARVSMMDEQGIFAQIAYPNALGFGGQRAMCVEPEVRLESIRVYNDAMADMQKDSGDRIYPMALLPWWDIDHSVAELERCAKMGFRGININPSPHEHGLPSLGEPAWNRLWEACVHHSQPVNFHIGASDSSTSFISGGTWPERNENQNLAFSGVLLFIHNLQVVGNILMSDLTVNHPDLNIVSVESGAGWVPYLLEALDYMSTQAGIDYKPSLEERFRSSISACVFFEREKIVQTIREVGEDNIMFETDFPHPACLYPNGLDYLVDAIAEMTEQERFKVFSGNAARIYNIDIS